MHRAAWPTVEEFGAVASKGDPAALDLAAEVLSSLRGAKSAAKVRMGSPIESAVLHDSTERLALFATISSDVVLAGKVGDMSTEAADDFSVETVIAPSE